MYKSYYLTENSSKNLLRTEGVIGTSMLLCILGIFCFVATNSFLSLSDWAVLENARGIETAAMGLFEGISTTKVFIQTMRVLVGVMIITFICTILGYVRRTFLQFAYMQRSDFLTMSFIGGTTNQISLGFALEPVMLMFVVLHIASLLANLAYQHFLVKGSVISWGMYLVQLFIILSCCLYIGLCSFLDVRRALHSFFDNGAVAFD